VFSGNTEAMRKHFPLLAISLGYFIVILDATIVNVAPPLIGRELGGGVSALQWVVDAYTVVFAGLLLSAGSLGDRLGARRVFDAGLAVFTVASGACALAPSVALLIAARAVQGLGAALLVPSSLALLRATYSDPSARARPVGAWGAIAGDRQGGGFDPAGQLLGIASLTLLTVGLIEGGAAGWTSPATVASLIAFVPAAALFVAVEARTRQPMLPLGLFQNRTFSGATIVGLAINLGFYGQRRSSRPPRPGGRGSPRAC
jgi:DHA2 family methylenomycin A resistance protein-like MFS transporter